MNEPVSHRQEVERDYHNKKTVSGQEQVVRRGKALASYEYFYNLIGKVENCKVLDFGCGDGWYSRQLAQKGANVMGIDISEELIKQAISGSMVENCNGSINFAVMPGENLAFKSKTFDMVAGSAILHHTDLPLAVSNIERVLKSNGRAIFIEPMNENVILKVWRKITPWRRSPVEKALTWSDLCLIQKTFPDVRMQFFNFFSILSGGLLLFLPGNRLALNIDRILDKIDRKILYRFTKLGKYCAVVVIEMRKTGE